MKHFLINKNCDLKMPSDKVLQGCVGVAMLILIKLG
ncbi:MAG: hypothetical protein ACJAW2_000190 [Shewanella sp.]|jgi:hypothetical protein